MHHSWVYFRVSLTLLANWLVFTTATAHDLWLIPPEKARLQQAVQILANSGMEFPLSEHAPNPARFKQLLLRLPDGNMSTLQAQGTIDHSGVMQFMPQSSGIYQVAVQTEPRIISLAAEEFNHYLVSDGLPHIYLERFKNKQLQQPATERYSKSPKCILAVGESNRGDPTQALGLTLEIVPLQNPLELRVGQTLKVKALYKTQPLADAHLGWDIPGDGIEHSGMVRSNEKGEALVPISQTGLMTIRLTYMTHPKTAEYEWESFWTSLTFRVP